MSNVHNKSLVFPFAKRELKTMRRALTDSRFKPPMACRVSLLRLASMRAAHEHRNELVRDGVMSEQALERIAQIIEPMSEFEFGHILLVALGGTEAESLKAA